MERALQTERSDIFIDYVGASDELTKGFDADGPETLLKSLDRLHHDRWSKHRVVTSLQWSSHYNGESGGEIEVGRGKETAGRAQAWRQADRQTDRQTDRHRERAKAERQARIQTVKQSQGHTQKGSQRRAH